MVRDPWPRSHHEMLSPKHAALSPSAILFLLRGEAWAWLRGHGWALGPTASHCAHCEPQILGMARGLGPDPARERCHIPVFQRAKIGLSFYFLRASLCFWRQGLFFLCHAVSEPCR